MEERRRQGARPRRDRSPGRRRAWRARGRCARRRCVRPEGLPARRGARPRRLRSRSRARVRARGVPVPDPYWTGTTSERAYTLQRRCDGDVPEVFEGAHAAQMLDFWERTRGRACPRVATGPNALSTRWSWATSSSSPCTRRSAPRAEKPPSSSARSSTSAARPIRRSYGAPTPCTATGTTETFWSDGETVTAVIDWESARAGDARLDLVLLNYWCDVYVGQWSQS